MPLSDKRKPGQKDSVSKGDKLTQELSAKGLCRDANASKCIWARVKGYPWWPAQALSKAAAKQHLGNVTHKSRSDVPVIFFGTSEIAWIGCKDVSNWEEGMRQSFHNKGRKNKKFVVALEQVREFLSITAERLAPHGWWCPAPARGAAPVPDEPFTSEDEEEGLQEDEKQQVVELHRQLSGLAGRYGAAAMAVADASYGSHIQLAAAAGAETTATVATAAGLVRHSGHSDNDEMAYGSSRRSAYVRPQLYKSSSRRGSETGHAGEVNGYLQGRRRRSSNAGYAIDSWSDQEQQEEEAYATATAAGHYSGMDNQQLARGGVRGHCSSFAHRQKRQLLQQEGRSDGGCSEGEMTDTESVAMAAMAIAELAQCSSWDQRRHELAVQLPAAAEIEEQPLMQTGVAGMHAAAATVDGEELEHRQLTDGSVLRVKLEIQDDGVGLGVIIKPDVPAAPANAPSGSCHQLPPHFGLPPVAAGHQKSRLASVGSVIAATLMGAADLPAVQHVEEQLQLPVHPPGKYEHGGEGLPCSCSWRYSVSVPSLGLSAVSSMGSNAVLCEDSQDVKAASEEQPGKDPQQQQQAPESSTTAAAAAEVQCSAVVQQEVPAVSTCVGTAYYRHLFASFGHNPDTTDDQEAADDLAAAAVDSQHAGGTVPAAHTGAAAIPVVERSALAVAAAAAPLGPRRARAPVPKYVAAANAAINAAFSGGLHASHAAAHIAQLTTSIPLAAAAAGGSSSSAARSDTSCGSVAAGNSGFRGLSWQRKRLNNSTSTAGSAAAAAAAAAAHVVTPADPVLDPVVGRLLLDNAPVLPNPTEAHYGFQLSREMLLNRPPKFEMLKRNLFVSRERPKRLPKDEVSVCCCRVKKVLMPDGTIQPIGCDSECLNRLSFIHCDPRTCPCGQYCTNRPFHLLKAPELDVFLTENRGHGVRVMNKLPPGTFVMEYAGEVIDQAELNRRMEAARDSGEQHFYIMEMGPGLFIDARRKGNYARLLNSCCDPNCETQKWRDAATGEVRIGIFTRKEVHMSEELTYDYMFEHYGLSTGLAQGFRCQCGAKNCRGTMDINPERRRDWGRRVEVFWEGDGVFYRGTVTGYSTSSGKHLILYDDGDLERVNLNQVPHRWLDGDASPHSSAQLPSGSPAPNSKLGSRPSPLPVTQPLLPLAAIAEAADSGSWSQTEQEAAAEDQQMLTSPRAAAAAAGRVGPGRANRVLGSSPLGPGGAAAAAAVVVPVHAGIKRPVQQMLDPPLQQQHQQHQMDVDGSLDDAEAAADALVVLGMAAEAELAEHTQQQQRNAQHIPCAAEDLHFQRPQSKKRRLNGYVDASAAGRGGALQWPQHSSTSSQSACLTQIGLASGGLDGASPLSPAGRVAGPAGRTLPGLSNSYQNPQLGARAMVQQGIGAQQPSAMDVDHASHPHGGTASSEEFLPWEQLIAGINAIKRQGPNLFQPVAADAAAAAAQQRGGVAGGSAAAGTGLVPHSRFGQLLNLVGQLQPVIEQKQWQLGGSGGNTSVQQQLQGLDNSRVSGSGGIIRAGSSCVSSSSCSTNSLHQLPLFCCRGSVQQQLQRLGSLAGGPGNSRPQQQWLNSSKLVVPTQQQQQQAAAGVPAAWHQHQQQQYPTARSSDHGMSVGLPSWQAALSAGVLAAAQQQQHQQQQQQQQQSACQPLQYHHSTSFTGSSAGSSTLQQAAVAAAVSSGMLAGGQQGLQQLKQQQIQLQVSLQQQQQQQNLQQQLQQHLAGGLKGAAATLQLQALKAAAVAAAAAAAVNPGAGAQLGKSQGGLGSSGSGGSPISAGSSGTAAAGSVATDGGGLAAAAAGMMSLLHAQTVAQ